MFPCFQTLTWRNDCHKNDSHIKLWISHSFWKDFYLYVLSFMISYGKTTLFRISWGCRLLRCYLNSVNSSVARVCTCLCISHMRELHWNLDFCTLYILYLFIQNVYTVIFFWQRPIYLCISSIKAISIWRKRDSMINELKKIFLLPPS